MRIFVVSDLHVDFKPNLFWLKGLSCIEYTEDILIVAGDITDNCQLLEVTFEILVKKFKLVVFVPGNHDLWVIRGPHYDSCEKFNWVMNTAREFGILTDRVIVGDFDIIPLLSWYDYSLANLNEQIEEVWSDFKYCRWPNGVTAAANYFHNMNCGIEPSGRDKNTITVSHFLPTLKVLPQYIPSKFDYLWPVLGSRTLGQQVEAIAPKIHVYGHSHVNTVKKIGETVYVNNALGYPNETHTRNKLFQIDNLIYMDNTYDNT